MSNSDKHITWAKAALADFEYFCKYCVKIRDKQGLVKPFTWNSSQRRLYYDTIKPLEDSKKPIRVIILKARQMGFSTFIEIYILWRLLRKGNIGALEMAHEKQESAPHIFGISRFAVKNLPQWFRYGYAAIFGSVLEEDYFTKTDVTFNTGSSLSVTSADSKEPGRSLTIQLLHLSECAYYEEAEKILAPLFAAMPKTNDTAVFMESTGNGPAGLFFNTFQRAKKGRNSYKALFFPWYEHEEYRMDVPEGIKPYCPPELEKLYQEGRITDEQLYWRQWVIENDFDGDETLFCVEYPSTEEQAWMSNSANWFDTGAIHQRLKEVDSVPYDEGFLYNDDGVVKFHASPDEKLHVFKYPEPGRVYVIGADAGSGVVVNREGDPSCADVLDVLTGEQVAHLHMTAKPTTFAFELKLLATWYNNAMIAPEVTGGHGLSAALWLIDNGYYNIFQKRVYDKTTQMFTNKIGWDTSRSNKIVVVNLLRAAFLNGEVIINEKGTLREMLTFIKPINKKTGTVRHDKAEAMAGAKDDRVISMCIANAVRKDMFSAQVPQLKAKEKEENREEESPPPPGFIRVNLRRPEVKQTSLNQVGF